MDHRETTIRVPLGQRSYDIVIRAGGLRALGDYLRQLGFSGQVGLVTNPVLARLYGQTAERSLRQAGYRPTLITIPEGERVKTLAWIARIIDVLMAQRFDRGAVLIALGGGVIGDMTGFTAAIYRRGIPFVQVATSLVAQVDSSVGGKTGVNHPLGKNMIGAFYQPAFVLVDPETLRTLPLRERIAGLAEVIKYGMITDRHFFSFLETNMADICKMDLGLMSQVITRCCEIKARVVRRDEKEAGLRRILNYGHTIGHALEALGRYRRLLHGEAVAIGMVTEATLAYHLGYCAKDVVERQRDLVRQAGLPWRLPPVSFVQLWDAMLHDKKVASGHIHCVLPRRIGMVTVEPLERASVKRWLADPQFYGPSWRLSALTKGAR